jgi:very-short-patch-repair endonuclease
MNCGKSWASIFRGNRSLQSFLLIFTVIGLVVEEDGDIHDLQQEEDERRERALSELGLKLVRFKNDEVLKDVSAVVERIKDMVESTS